MVGAIDFTNASMSALRQAVVRVDSLTAAGYRPVFTPIHQVDLDTGKMASTSRRRRNSGVTVWLLLSIPAPCSHDALPALFTRCEPDLWERFKMSEVGTPSFD